MICIWVVDVRGSLTPIRQYKRRGRVTTAVFCVLPFKLDSLKKSSTDSKFTFSPSFFFGTDQGALVYADDLGHCTDVQQLVSPIDIMLFFEERSRLIIITRSLLLTQYQVADDGRVTRISQVKLSLPVDNNSGLKFVVWAAPGVIALAANEKFIRLFDIITDENYNLPLSADKNNCIPKSDSVHAIAFSRIDRYLVVGTKLGNILIWKYSGSMRDFSGDNKMAVEIIGTSVTDWELCYSTNLPISSPSPIIEFQWHRSNGSLGIVTEEGVVVLSEMKMQIGICDELSVIQTGSHEVTVTINGAKNPIVQATAILIKGISVASSCFLVWSGKDARVFKVDAQPGKIRVEPLDAFITNGSSCAISDNIHIAEESIFIAEQNSVRICNFTGIQKQTISFSEAEGIVQHISVNGRNLATITDKGIIGIYDVHSPKKPKPLGSTGQFFSAADNVGGFYPLDIRGIKVNCDGSRVAILADHVEGSLRVRHPDTRLHVYDRNKGSVNTFNFNSFSRFPVNVCWDSSDHRILAVEAQILRHLLSKTTKLNDTKSDLNNTTDSNLDTESDVDIYLFFATSEDGILFQDSFPRKSPFGSLLGLIVPRLYFVSSVVKSNEKESVEENDVKVMSKVMRDFVGLEDCNEATKAALLDFSYNITLGKVDDAYRAVRAIASPTIWENMAQICVKTKRLDVAEVCLGQMGHVRGAAALRDSKKYNNVDASIGVLALQLGLYDDAIRCFREANRPDLMNQLYQAAGLWEKAVKIAKSQDHIHLQATHFQYAKHLESIHDVKGAIKHFKQSNTFRQEVPRMLYALGRMDQLEKFVESTFSSQQDEDENVKTHDPILLKWWGSYLESEKNYDLALTYYNRANDYLSVVRILCFLGQYEEAANTIMEVGDRAGAYHFARQLEHQGEYHEAINFYAMAGCYNHSIRLAKAYSMDADLMGYALKSGSSSLMFDCASYFENKREFEKAVELYYKCGDFGRALELCFRVGEQLKSRGKNEQSVAMFDMMNTIVQSLGTEDGSNNISPQTLARCAEFHIKHKQFEKAIDLYVLAHKFTQAFEMCLQYKVPLNESLVEKLTPPSSVISDVQERKNTLKHLAEVLKNQSLWSLAYKKYMEAGDQINAMKSLVRTGDAKKIITAAKIANKTDMYIIAANYLQQLDWRENIEILKAIILFYTKAKAFEQLATFYDSVASKFIILLFVALD